MSLHQQSSYEVLSEAICSVRCSAPLGADWKKRIDEDYNARKDEKRIIQAKMAQLGTKNIVKMGENH